MNNRAFSAGRGAVLSIAAALAIVTLFAIPASSDTSATARKTLENWEKAVVTVQLVVKMRISVEGWDSYEMDEQMEATGTIIDPSGLTIIPFSVTNPGEALGLGESFGAQFDMKIDFQTEVTDLTMILSDGTEIPANIVLRDRDLDLVFLSPKQKQETPLPSVDLASDFAPQVLESLMTISRLGKVANRTVAASVSRVQAIVDRPRTFYVLRTPRAMGDIGIPVFSLDGRLAGIRLLRTIPGSRDSFFGSDSMLPVVIPSADIAEAAKQALAAQAPS